MAAATILAQSENATEFRRKSLLAESDVLLDDVETLRLEDKTHAPPRFAYVRRSMRCSSG